MPNTTSIFRNVENGEYQIWNCCEDLNFESIHIESYVPMVGMIYYRDITNKYIKWLEFVKRAFEIPFTYEIVNKTVKGWLTHEHYKKIIPKIKDYFVCDSANLYKTPKHSDIIIRVSHTDFFLYKNDELRMGVYNGFIFNSTHKKSGLHFGVRDDLFSYDIPFMVIKFPNTYGKEKYLNWSMVRLYTEYPYLSNFLLENEERLSTLLSNKRTWYNILFYTSMAMRSYSILSYSLPLFPVDRDYLIEDGFDTYEELFDYEQEEFPENFAKINHGYHYVGYRHSHNIHGMLSKKESDILFKEIQTLINKCTQ